MSKKTLRCHPKNGFGTSYGKERKSELHYIRKSALHQVKKHTDYSYLFGGADTGCLLSAVAAKRK